MKKSDNISKNESKHSHSGHMKMMAICCGLPIVGFLLIAGLGINSPSLETILFIVCPIGMIAMMYMMRTKTDSKNKSCCTTETVKDEASEKSRPVTGSKSCCSTEKSVPMTAHRLQTIQKPLSCCCSDKETQSKIDQPLIAQAADSMSNLSN